MRLLLLLLCLAPTTTLQAETNDTIDDRIGKLEARVKALTAQVAECKAADDAASEAFTAWTTAAEAQSIYDKVSSEGIEKNAKDIRKIIAVILQLNTVGKFSAGSDVSHSGKLSRQSTRTHIVVPKITHPASTAPSTAMGNRSHSHDKHLEDAKEWLMKDARAAVRKGLLTEREFEKFTGVEY